MLHLLLGCQLNSDMAEQIPQMISTHIALRRRANPTPE
jgi:hypothetical protein